MNNPDFYEKISLKLLELLRANRTQLEMSQLMGYQTNQYYKFEAGLKKFRLEDLIKICEINNLDLKEFLNNKLELKLEDLSVHSVQKELFRVWSSHKMLFIKKVLSLNESRLKRVLRGESEFSIPEFLMIVDKVADRLSAFLSCFSSLDCYTEYELPFEKRYDLIDLYFKYPEALVIESATKMKQINDFPDHLKKDALLNYTQIKKEKFEIIYDYLIDHGFLKINDGKYQFNGRKVEVQYGERTNEYVGKVWEYLKNISKYRIDSHGKYYGTSTRIAPVSKQAQEKINSILKESYRQIAEVIDLDEEREKSDILYLRREAFYHHELEDIKSGKISREDKLNPDKY